jgi:transposase-like protein
MIGDDIEVCPDCDSHNIRQRQPSHFDTGTTHKYRCTTCKARFDEPVVRPKKSESASAQTILKRLGVDLQEVDV